MRFCFLCDVTQRMLVVNYRRFGRTYTISSVTETSVNNYKSTARNIPEQRRSDLSDCFVIRYFTITLRHTTVGSTTLDEWSALRIDPYLTTHNTYKRKTSMPSSGLEPAIPGSERPHTHASHRAATWFDFDCVCVYIYICVCLCIYVCVCVCMYVCMCVYIYIHT